MDHRVRRDDWDILEHERLERLEDMRFEGERGLRDERISGQRPEEDA